MEMRVLIAKTRQSEILPSQCRLVCLTLSVNKVASGYSLRVTMLTLLKKQIITQSILQFSLIFCMHKDKGDCPGCPARVNEMMETQRPGHVDWGDGDVCVCPLGRVKPGGIFKKVDMDLNVQSENPQRTGENKLAGHLGSYFWHVWN